jgi:hypothetical protein
VPALLLIRPVTARPAVVLCTCVAHLQLASVIKPRITNAFQQLESSRFDLDLTKV